MILISACVGDRNIYLVNVYAPTKKKQKATFFKRFSNWVQSHGDLKSYTLVFGGDFNCVDKPDFDTIGAKSIYKKLPEYNLGKEI